MADSARCEVCKKSGLRRRGQVSPEGWSFAEVTNDEDPDGIIIVWACSEACRTNFWTPGPGRLDLITGEITPKNPHVLDPAEPEST